MRRAIALCALLAISTPARAQETEDYTVRRGDTCGQIARARYGHSRRYDLIHQANPELGPMPHHLTPGQVLHLPVLPDQSAADATVTAMRRTVRHQRPSQGEWTPSHVGQDLNQGWRLSTGSESTAELSFRRSSAATIREETLVIVYGTGVERVRHEGSRAVVRQGSILSRLRSLSGADPDEPLEVETPSARATLRDGESQVDVDESGTTRVAVHTGGNATVTTAEGEGAVQVRPGHGTSVQPGQRPARPRPLPRAPRWVPGPHRFVGLHDGGGTIRGRWEEAPRAARYRVEVARRRDGRDLVIATAVPATVREMEMHRLPPGTYYVRVATIDDEQFEGRPAQPIELEVVPAELIAPGATTPLDLTNPDDPYGLEGLDDGLGDLDHVGVSATPPRVPRYATLMLPDDIRCRFGASDPVQQLRLVDEGPLALTCAAGDEEVGGLAMQVLASSARLEDREGHTLETLPRAETAVRVLLDPSIRDVSGLTLLAPEGVAVADVGPHPDGGIEAVLTASEAIEAERVVVRVATSDESHLPIADAEVALAPGAVADTPPPPPSVEPEPEIPDPHGLQEAFGLAAFASMVGLRDERRSGSGMHLALSFASAESMDPDAQLRVTGGARAAFLDDYLRVEVAVPLDLASSANRTANRGSRDVYFAVSSRVLNEGMIGLAVEAGIWAPTAGDQGLDRGRLMIAADFSLRFLDDDRLAVRTRQAGVFDLVGSGSVLWSSAYGFDVWIAGPLSAGVELDLSMGHEDGVDLAAGAVGAGLALDLG
ncbi:MAG: LysM peptidoglycan-binding domain-containing protein, partial [Myxococcales bacterium]|nr:LysM peptidoglycan-binding domain-containing protein [Myxococcales bacterium]